MHAESEDDVLAEKSRAILDGFCECFYVIHVDVSEPQIYQLLFIFCNVDGVV